MKLQHLPIGARFEYEGKVFVKTGPITASSEQGGQCMIPRYADLKILEAPVSESPAGRRGKLDETRIRAAFVEFHQTCSQLIDASAQPALEAARQKFLAALK